MHKYTVFIHSFDGPDDSCATSWTWPLFVRHPFLSSARPLRVGVFECLTMTISCRFHVQAGESCFRLPETKVLVDRLCFIIIIYTAAAHGLPLCTQDTRSCAHTHTFGQIFNEIWRRTEIRVSRIRKIRFWRHVYRAPEPSNESITWVAKSEFDVRSKLTRVCGTVWISWCLPEVFNERKTHIDFSAIQRNQSMESIHFRWRIVSILAIFFAFFSTAVFTAHALSQYGMEAAFAVRTFTPTHPPSSRQQVIRCEPLENNMLVSSI